MPPLAKSAKVTLKIECVEPPAMLSSRTRAVGAGKFCWRAAGAQIFEEPHLLQSGAAVAALSTVPTRAATEREHAQLQAHTVHTERSAGGGDKGADWAGGGGLVAGARRRLDAFGHGPAYLHLHGRVHRLQAKD